jgi:hypothetical protein
VGRGGFKPTEGWTFIIRIDLLGSPGLGKAYKSEKSRRASPGGRGGWDRNNDATCFTLSFLLTLTKPVIEFRIESGT